jgi:hypothetical protein
MKIGSTIKNRTGGVPGAAGLVLITTLMACNGTGTGAAKPATVAPLHSVKARRIPSPPPDTNDELSRYDPEIRLDLLNDQHSHPLPIIDRNPFEFPPPKPVVDFRARIIGPQLPPPPPPPPPLTIKLIGYSDKGGGVKVGIISDDEDIYVVREGETFDKIFKVTKLTPLMVEIYDESTHRTVDLPITP